MTAAVVNETGNGKYFGKKRVKKQKHARKASEVLEFTTKMDAMLEIYLIFDNYFHTVPSILKKKFRSEAMENYQ